MKWVFDFRAFYALGGVILFFKVSVKWAFIFQLFYALVVRSLSFFKKKKIGGEILGWLELGFWFVEILGNGLCFSGILCIEW